MKQTDGKIIAKCDRTPCAAMLAGTRDELVAAGWQPLARKGGKTAWQCPNCDPRKGPPPGMGRSTT